MQHLMSVSPGQSPDSKVPPEQPLLDTLRQKPAFDLHEISTQHYVRQSKKHTFFVIQTRTWTSTGSLGQSERIVSIHSQESTCD
jgi:hypothetical protein